MNPDTIYLKRWTTIRAQACRAGIQTHRTDPADGPVRYLSLRFGVPRLFNDLEALADYVADSVVVSA